MCEVRMAPSFRFFPRTVSYVRIYSCLCNVRWQVALMHIQRSTANPYSQIRLVNMWFEWMKKIDCTWSYLHMASWRFSQEHIDHVPSICLCPGGGWEGRCEVESHTLTTDPRPVCTFSVKTWKHKPIQNHNPTIFLHILDPHIFSFHSFGSILLTGQ